MSKCNFSFIFMAQQVHKLFLTMTKLAQVQICFMINFQLLILVILTFILKSNYYLIFIQLQHIFLSTYLIGKFFVEDIHSVIHFIFSCSKTTIRVLQLAIYILIFSHIIYLFQQRFANNFEVEVPCSIFNLYGNLLFYGAPPFHSKQSLFYLLFFMIFSHLAQLLILLFQQNSQPFNLILQLCFRTENAGIVRFVFRSFGLIILFFQLIQIIIENNRTACLACSGTLRIVFSVNSGRVSRIFLTYFIISIIETQILGCFRDIVDFVLLFIETVRVTIVVCFFHNLLLLQFTKHNHYQMQIIALIAILYFFVGACICLLICVNPNDPGALGSARRFVFTTIPSAFSSFVRRVFGERVLGYLGKAKHWLLQTNHPLVQWFYFLISPGGFTAYTVTGIFKHMPNEYISDIHIIIAYVLAGICFWVYYKACSVSPGEIKDSTFDHYVQKFKHHYDGIMYKQNNKCTTCNVTKPARSKHCSVCKMCVSKFDHHCIWIRQCVGQRNYKYFVSFLFLHSVWCSYLSVIGGISLYQTLIKMRFWDMQFRMGNQIVKGDNLLAIQYLFVMDTLFFFLIVMCAIMGITLGIFVTYHFYLIGVGQTTNQRVKKNDYIDYLKKQKKGLKKYVDQHPQLPAQVDYKGEKMPKKQFLAFQQDVNWRLSVLEKKTPNSGFWVNLKTVFSEPDK